MATPNPVPVVVCASCGADLTHDTTCTLNGGAGPVVCEPCIYEHGVVVLQSL